MITCPHCKVEKDDSGFYWRNRAKGKRNSWCKTCADVLTKKWRLLNRIDGKTARIRLQEIRQWILKLKAERQCKVCAFANPIALDFHHRDPNEKVTEIASATQRGWSKKRLLTEMKKCDVLCANCHRIEEEKNRRVIQW